MVFADLHCKAADEVESTYNALICDNRERLPTKLDSNTKFATKIKLQHGILNNTIKKKTQLLFPKVARLRDMLIGLQLSFGLARTAMLSNLQMFC